MREATKKRVRLLSRIFFGFYILLLIYFMFFSEEWGRNFMGGEYQYNYFPFARSGVIFSITGRLAAGLSF